MIKYTLTNDSASVMHGGQLVTVKRGAPNFNALRTAILAEDWAAVPAHLKAGTSLEKWAKGRFKVTADGKLSYDGQAVDPSIHERIVQMASEGKEPAPLFAFYERLQRNPSNRSVSQLWGFLSNKGIPLTEDGCFLGYKGVRADFKDVYTGAIDNRPGQTVKIPRNQISEDPDQTCHFGLHVGAHQYASGFGPTEVVVKVDPEHVVCIPSDYNAQKMRVCEYTVIGLCGEEMPSTSVEDDYVPKARTKGKKRSKAFLRLDALSASELMDESYDDLRTYASKGLQIVGASRIRGGKLALVTTILKSRG